MQKAPTKAEVERARMMAEWAGDRISCSSVSGLFKGAQGVALQTEVAHAIALIVRRVREEAEHG